MLCLSFDRFFLSEALELTEGGFRSDLNSLSSLASRLTRQDSQFDDPDHLRVQNNRFVADRAGSFVDETLWRNAPQRLQTTEG